MASGFGDALAACIESIPEGRVATCGAIARSLGDVRAARAVAEWIRNHPELDPRRQVVRADGHPILASSRRGTAAAPSARFVDELEAHPILAELRAEQKRMAGTVRETDERRDVRTLGGVDVAYEGDRAFAAAVLLDAQSLRVLETAHHEMVVQFPYIPTYLAFREFPAVEEAVSALHRTPDVLFIDGHGRLHPALFGFACFAGVALDIPCVGIAKHPLAGTAVPAQRAETGAVPIELRGAVRGYAWKSPTASRAFYVSVGHRVSLNKALALAQGATRDRYPEPLRIADRLSKEGKGKKKEERHASGPTLNEGSSAYGSGGL